MKCADLQKHFDEYLDQECAPEIRDLIDEHLTACADCRAELAARRAFANALSRLEEEELPCDFDAVFKERLAEEKRLRPQKKPLYRRGWARGLTLAACLLLVVGVFGVFAGGRGGGARNAPAGNETAMYEETGYDLAAEAPAVEPRSANAGGDMLTAESYEAPAAEPQAAWDDADTGEKLAGNAEVVIERKIIKNWYLSLKTADYDETFTALEELAVRYSGYVVNANTYQSEDSAYREGWISLRVDAAQADAAVAEISTLGVVESSNYSTSDVTAAYYDIEARLSQYQAQEQRLLEMYDAAETVSDLVTIETELVRVQSEIESMQGTLRYYDQLTALSLIEINLYTPNPYTQSVEPQGWAGFVQNLRESFLRGVNNLLDFIARAVYWLVSALPVLAILAVLTIVIVVLARRSRKGK